MYNFTLYSSRRGFSILVALGTTGFLLILAVGLANIFIGEMKINRMVYDGIMSQAAAEGAFEYAKLKIKNHRDGFSDAVLDRDIDARALYGSLPRSSGVMMNYTIKSQSNDAIFSLLPGEYLILPLFVGDDTLIGTGGNSKNPTKNDRISAVSEINIDGLDSNHSWTLLGTTDAETIGLTGNGNINFGTSKGITRKKTVQCYDRNAQIKPAVIPLDTNGRCPSPYDNASGGEELEYFYDTEILIKDFMSSGAITEKFISIFNNSDIESTVSVKTNSPFALPTSELITNGRIGKTSQTLRFTEDKSKYYDALKYGLYETD